MKPFALLLPGACLSLAVATSTLSAQGLTQSFARPAASKITAPGMSTTQLVVPSQSQTSSNPATVSETPRGPSADAARAGIAPRSSNERTLALATDDHVGAGQNIALMVVGGAALITGLIIGGDGGTLIAVGGAAVGLFGLYNFIK